MDNALNKITSVQPNLCEPQKLDKGLIHVLACFYVSYTVEVEFDLKRFITE